MNRREFAIGAAVSAVSSLVIPSALSSERERFSFYEDEHARYYKFEDVVFELTDDVLGEPSVKKNVLLIPEVHPRDWFWEATCLDGFDAVYVDRNFETRYGAAYSIRELYI